MQPYRLSSVLLCVYTLLTLCSAAALGECGPPKCMDNRYCGSYDGHPAVVSD